MSVLSQSRTKNIALVVACGAAIATVTFALLNTRSSVVRLAFPPYQVHPFSPGFTISPQGKFAVAVDSHFVGLWDLATGAQRGLFMSEDHKDFITSLAFSPDGRYMATAGGNTVVLWDLESHEQKTVLRGHKYGVMDVAFSPDGRYLASAETDQDTTFLWDLATFEIAARFPGTLSGFPRLEFSPDSKKLAVLSRSEHMESEVGIWDVNTDKRWMTLRDPSIRFKQMAFSHDGRFLAVAGRREDELGPPSYPIIHFWTRAAGWDFHAGLPPGDVYRLRFTPDDKFLVVAGTVTEHTDGQKTDVPSLRFLDARSGEVKHTIPGEFTSFAFTPDGKSLVAVLAREVVRYDLANLLGH